MYPYIGPPEIVKQVSPEKTGTVIRSRSDAEAWLAQTGEQPDYGNEITVTFVIDLQERLRINPRRSEHVVCAGGNPVLSAGELTFETENGTVLQISGITNLSTGYCPAPDSWERVRKALSGLDMSFPDYFTDAYIFSVCLECGRRQIVKDNFYVCLICNADLPESL